jgi:hypothetical protein
MPKTGAKDTTAWPGLLELQRHRIHGRIGIYELLEMHGPGAAANRNDANLFTQRPRQRGHTLGLMLSRRRKAALRSPKTRSRASAGGLIAVFQLQGRNARGERSPGPLKASMPA